MFLTAKVPIKFAIGEYNISSNGSEDHSYFNA